MKVRLAVVALLLAAPVGLAAQTFSASSIDLEWNTLQATLVAVDYRRDGPGDHFQLQAEAVQLETDSMKMATAGEIGFGTQAPSTTASTFGSSSWNVSTWDTTTSLFILPRTATVRSVEGHGTAALPQTDCVRQPTYFASNRAVACPDTTTSIDLQGTARQWRFTGDFTMALWSWQGTIHEDGRSTTFWTGGKPTQANAMGFGEFEYRQAFLHVTNGTLTLTTTGDVAVYASSITAVTRAASIRLGASDDNVTAVAPGTELRLGRTSEELVGRVLAGALLGPSTRMPSQPLGWPAGALGAALLVAPFSVVLIRRNRGLTHMSLANENLDLDNHRAAARHARLAVRYRQVRKRASLVGAVACLRFDDLQGAEEFLRDLHGCPRHDEGACRFLWARLRVLQGHCDEGQSLLEQCLKVDASYVQEAQADSVLAPFLDPSMWSRRA